MKRKCAVVAKQDGGWWIGRIEEVTGVNSQAGTRKELLANLHSALEEALELNREDALRAAVKDYAEESILV